MNSLTSSTKRYGNDAQTTTAISLPLMINISHRQLEVDDIPKSSPGVAYQRRRKSEPTVVVVNTLTNVW